MMLITVLFLTFAVGAGPTWSLQERPTTRSAPPGRTKIYDQSDAALAIDFSQDHLVAPGDVLEIRVEDAPELSNQYRVTASGEIEMQVIGRLTVWRQTTYELARLIARALREQEYLKNPNVTVSVREYNSQAFIIQGAVGKPGLYRLENRPSALTLIGLAGGLTDNHGSTIFILRPRQNQRSSDEPQIAAGQGHPVERSPAASADYDLIKVNLSALYEGRFGENHRLEPGDIVSIPRADVFFVAGEVKGPGSFPLKEGTTLRQAISLAQGMTYKARSSHGMIFREDPVTGSRREIKVDIGAVMSGKQEDIPVRANDVIIIPNSQAKSVGGAILMTLGANSVRLP